MELDDLKDIWKKNVTDFKAKGEAELAMMLKGNSKSIVGKLKRNVWFELVFTFAAGVLFLGYALTLDSGALKWTTISMLVLFVAYSFYYLKKLAVLNKFNPASENLRTHVDTLITTLNSYLKFYKRSFTVLYPAYFLLALVFGGLERGAEAYLESLARIKIIAYLLFLAVFYFFCATWLTNWYLKKLYGNHLDKLKKLAHELEN